MPEHKIKEIVWCVSLYEKYIPTEIPRSWCLKDMSKNKWVQQHKDYFILQSDRKWEIVPWINEWDYLMFWSIDKPVYKSYCLFNTNSIEWFKIIYAMKSYTDIFKNWGNLWDVPKEDWTPVWKLVKVYRIYN